MIKVPLSRPIQAHGEEVRELKLREPSAKELRVFGLPFNISAGGQVLPDAASIARHIGALADVPPSSVDQMSAADFMAATAAVLSFFGTAPDGSSPASS